MQEMASAGCVLLKELSICERYIPSHENRDFFFFSEKLVTINHILLIIIKKILWLSFPDFIHHSVPSHCTLLLRFLIFSSCLPLELLLLLSIIGMFSFLLLYFPCYSLSFPLHLIVIHELWEQRVCFAFFIYTQLNETFFSVRNGACFPFKITQKFYFKMMWLLERPLNLVWL